jgi:hypothetical protein
VPNARDQDMVAAEEMDLNRHSGFSRLAVIRGGNGWRKTVFRGFQRFHDQKESQC